MLTTQIKLHIMFSSSILEEEMFNQFSFLWTKNKALVQSQFVSLRPSSLPELDAKNDGWFRYNY